MADIVFSPAVAQDLETIVDLLKACGLPHEDIHRHFAVMILAKRDDWLLGTVALEEYARVGLIRSLAVVESWRNRGLASELLSRIVDRAGAKGVAELFLLTTTAQHFFAKRKFAAVSRDEVPPAIAVTEEFRSLCPSTAVCMRRQLSTA